MIGYYHSPRQKMGNTVLRSEAPGDYHKVAYKNLQTLIEKEDGGPDEEFATCQPSVATPVTVEMKPGINTTDLSETPRNKRSRFDTTELKPPRIKTARSAPVQRENRNSKRFRAEPVTVGTRRSKRTPPKKTNRRLYEDEVDYLIRLDPKEVDNSCTHDDMEWCDTAQLEATEMVDDTLPSPCPKIIAPWDYDLPFENIVFEGGGNKGLAHCGALRYLEKIGIRGDKIKRVAGASAGSIMAALLAVGYSATEIEKEMRHNNMKTMFLDGSWLGIVRNLFWHFGMHEANVIYKWLGAKLAEKAKTKKLKENLEDITFEEVYTHFGKELCVVVTNLNWMTTEYCHPKTTPRMPVREAVRMSTSLPGLFTAKQYTLHGDTDIFVDGGVLCNYPIHCFDGWYLSMEPENNFTEKMLKVEDLHQLHESRFDEGYVTNFKTLGISIYAEHENDLLKNDLEIKYGQPEPERPRQHTPLYEAWEQKNIRRRQNAKFRKKREMATLAFLKVLQECEKDENGEITRDDIEQALEEDPFLHGRKKEIFGVDPRIVFNILDAGNTGKIPYDKLIAEVGDLGLQIQNRSLGCQRSIIDGFYSFLDRIQSTLLINVKKSYVKMRDVERTVGINTGHAETNSFDLDDEDKNFLIERGENACRKYIQRFIEDHRMRPRVYQPPATV